jgi:membrane-associated protease RseP (regulator of RpoE activity)
MTLVLLIFLTITAVSFVWAVTTALTGRLLGATLLKVVFFNGPSLRIARLGTAEVRLGLLPIGSSVQFLDAAAVEEAHAEALSERRLLEDLPFAARLLILVIGWIPVFLLAAIPLGLPGAATELGEAFGQIVRFFRDPAYPALALGSLQMELAAGHWALAAAVVGLKVTAINLLPLPILAGGKILEEIASALTRRTVRWPSLLVTLSFFGCLLALFYFVKQLWKVIAQ